MATTKSRRASVARVASPSRRPAKRRRQAEAARPSPAEAVRARARRPGPSCDGHGTDAVALGAPRPRRPDRPGPRHRPRRPARQRGCPPGITALLGNGAFLVPLALPRGRRCSCSGAAPTTRSAAPLRVGSASFLIVLAAVGLLHLLGGAPPLSDPVDALRDAGGYLGARDRRAADRRRRHRRRRDRAARAARARVPARVGPLAPAGRSSCSPPGSPSCASAFGAAFPAPTETPTTPTSTTSRAVAPRAGRDAGAPRSTRSRSTTTSPSRSPSPNRRSSRSIAVAPAVARARRRRRRRTRPRSRRSRTSEGQMAIDLTAYGHGDWTLPGRELLKRQRREGGRPAGRRAGRRGARGDDARLRRRRHASSA